MDGDTGNTNTSLTLIYQPVAANGEKMSMPPPSPTGTTQPLSFSQNSFCSWVSRVFSESLLSVKADKNGQHCFIVALTIVVTHCEGGRLPQCLQGPGGPVSELAAQIQRSLFGLAEQTASLCGHTGPQ